MFISKWMDKTNVALTHTRRSLWVFMQLVAILWKCQCYSHLLPSLKTIPVMMNLYLFANKNFCFVHVNFVASLFLWQCTLMVGGYVCAPNLLTKNECALMPQRVQYRAKWDMFMSLLLFLKLQWGRSRPVCDVRGWGNSNVSLQFGGISSSGISLVFLLTLHSVFVCLSVVLLN